MSESLSRAGIVSGLAKQQLQLGLASPPVKLEVMRSDDDMKIQNITGQLTEQKVQDCLKSIGLETDKPKRDIGLDFEVWHPANPAKKVYVQIKGRGKIQKNKRYRWFQIRTTKKRERRYGERRISDF